MTAACSIHPGKGSKVSKNGSVFKQALDVNCFSFDGQCLCKTIFPSKRNYPVITTSVNSRIRRTTSSGRLDNDAGLDLSTYDIESSYRRVDTEATVAVSFCEAERLRG